MLQLGFKEGLPEKVAKKIKTWEMGEQAVWISGSSTFHSGGSSKQKALRLDVPGIQFKEAIGSGMGGERGKDRWSRRSWEADHEGLVGQG